MNFLLNKKNTFQNQKKTLQNLFQIQDLIFSVKNLRKSLIIYGFTNNANKQ